MKMFDVYPVYPIEPVKGKGRYIWDKEGNKYLDLYGGHAVISIGHSHPHYVEAIKDQVEKLGFYSNSIINSLQNQLADKLGKLSGLEDYKLFLSNSGAEANENALKVASFVTGKSRIISFNKAFHGRTSAAVSVTDNPKIQAEINKKLPVTMLPLNDLDAVEEEISKGDVCAVIIEGIQGIGGIHIPKPGFLEELERLCKKYRSFLILDEIQSGYGRSGRFFAYQKTNIRPHIVTTAKGMGNGFPVGGTLIAPEINAWHGMLGTTFGGNHLACAASIAVLEVIENENLISNAKETGDYLMEKLRKIEGIKELRGEGLMAALEFNFEVKELRKNLVFDQKIFTGVSGINVIRLLPPLNLTKAEADIFIVALKTELKKLPTWEKAK